MNDEKENSNDVRVICNHGKGFKELIDNPENLMKAGNVNSVGEFVWNGVQTRSEGIETIITYLFNSGSKGRILLDVIENKLDEEQDPKALEFVLNRFKGIEGKSWGYQRCRSFLCDWDLGKMDPVLLNQAIVFVCKYIKEPQALWNMLEEYVNQEEDMNEFSVVI